LRCAPPPPPLTLPPPQRRRQAATNVALSRCHHRLAAAKLPPTSLYVFGCGVSAKYITENYGW
jgi:hypothetical protein